MIDYLIIGSGLAGIAFTETALQHHKSVAVIDTGLYHSSKVAAGLYNPVVLKRFTPLANAQEQIDLLHVFYSRLEDKLDCKFLFDTPTLRKFFSIEEQNNWFVASDKRELSAFLSARLSTKKYSGIDSPFDFGVLNQSGYVNASLLLEKYRSFLSKNNLLLDEAFNYSDLKVGDDGVAYRSIKARHIVFAEGFGMHNNPYFQLLPLDGAKGELLTIKAPGLSLDVILNSSVFILPIGNDLFKVGATYNWTDKTETPTAEAKQELTKRIKEILTCDFEIIAHQAGVRPTVKDRKPLLGTHVDFPRIHILNGLGTRGVMLAPAMAKALYENIEDGIPLPREIDIRRFDPKK